MPDLERFRTAQAQGHGGLADALAELRAGRKQGHWIWYVFPQLAGLGHSSMAQAFGIRGREEAADYLRDPTLRTRLGEAVDVVREQLAGPRRPRLDELLGSHIDALKLVSSLTLFEAVARELFEQDGDHAYARLATSAAEILAIADTHGYARCPFTTRALRPAP